MQQRGAPRPWERLARSSTPLEGISYNDARTANEYEKAELARLKRWQLGGELIERKRRSVSSSASSTINAMLNELSMVISIGSMQR